MRDNEARHEPKKAAPAKKAAPPKRRFYDPPARRSAPATAAARPADNRPPEWAVVGGRVVPGRDRMGPQLQQWTEEVGDAVSSTPKQGSYMINPPGPDGNPRDLNGPGISAKADAEMRTEQKASSDALAAQLKARREARKSDMGKLSPMDWKTYEKLDDDSRAAVDFNGLLAEAWNKDRALLKNDANGDGILSLDEAGDSAKGLKGYSKAYERVFGKPAEGEEMGFAPATLGLLNQLDVRDMGGAVNEYTSGSGFITEDDIQAQRHTKGMVDAGPNGYKEPRGAWMTTLTEKMGVLEDTLAKGRTVRDGVRLKLGLSGTSRAQRSSFVDQAAGGLSDAEASQLLRLSGNDPRFSEDRGIDVTSLTSPGSQKKLAALGDFYSAVVNDPRYTAGQITPDNLLDLKWMKGDLQALGIDGKDWLGFVKSKQGITDTEETDLDKALKANATKER